MNGLRDARFALRALARAPGFTCSTVLVLALGIGANTAVFSVLDQSVIRPLPYADPDRLAMVWEDFSAFGTPKNRVSPATFFDWKRRTRAFVDLAALRVSMMNLAESGAPEQVLGAAVTANLLTVVGIEPLVGRGFTIDEEPPGHRVVVLSHRLWQRRFDGAPNVLGRSFVMSGEPYTVVGVMPPAFHFPDARTDFWVPIGLQPQQRTARNSHYLRVVGRLRPDSSWAAARDDMRAVAGQLAREFPRTNDRIGVAITPLAEEVTADARRALTLLLGATASVLLIACANIANLLLARASGRRRDIAVRLALGASRGSILRQLLTESFLLSAGGAIAGVAIAGWSLQGLARFVPPALSTSIDIHLDLRAMLFTTLVAAATALIVGLAPTLQIVSRSAMDSLRAHGGAGPDRRGARLRRGLVIAETAIALVLVVAAALLIKTLFRLRAVDPGFRADHVLTADISVPYPKYADATRRQRFYSDLVARVGTLPGVVHAGLTSDLPYTSRADYQSLRIENLQRAADLGQDALFRLVSTDYLQTIGAKLRVGRLLDDRDRAGTLPVVVVNEALARTYWPNVSALGHRIDTGTGDGAPLWMTVVGVVEEIKERGLDYGPKPAVYVPFTQTTIAFYQPSEIAIRTSVPPEAVAAGLRQAVAAIDPEQPVSEIRTMDDVVDVELAPRQQMLSLLGVFAGLALLLAALGIYSVLSYLVAERRREIALRIAIGASSGAVVRAILGQSATLAAAGIALGLAGALATSRWLGSLLFDVSPADPVIMIGVSILLAGVALVASFVPARRAAATDPMLLLRAE